METVLSYTAQFIEQGYCMTERTPGESLPSHETVPWLARLTIDLHPGVVRHPRLLDRVREELGRPCAINISHEGVALSYTAKGESFEEAAEDSTEVCENLLDNVLLGGGTVSEHILIPADELQTWRFFHPVQLRSVPNE